MGGNSPIKKAAIEDTQPEPPKSAEEAGPSQQTKPAEPVKPEEIQSTEAPTGWLAKLTRFFGKLFGG
jgi:hypothetical protein